MLGSHPCAAHVGEVKALRNPAGSSGKQYCYVCGSAERCPVFQGISPESIDRAYDIIFSNVPPDVRVLIDISKKPFWARRYLHCGDFSRTYIHLIRDPRALIRRWLRMPEKKRWKQRLRLARLYPGSALSLLAGTWWHVFLYKWLQQNREISFFLRCCGLDFISVTYAELAGAPCRTVRSLTERLGLCFERDQLRYWKTEHHGTRKKEYEWVREHNGFYHDLRWKAELPDHIQRAVTENGRIAAYLDQQGLCFTENGIVHRRHA
jgi:hypothetical protein